MRQPTLLACTLLAGCAATVGTTDGTLDGQEPGPWLDGTVATVAAPQGSAMRAQLFGFRDACETLVQVYMGRTDALLGWRESGGSVDALAASLDNVESALPASYWTLAIELPTDAVVGTWEIAGPVAVEATEVRSRTSWSAELGLSPDVPPVPGCWSAIEGEIEVTAWEEGQSLTAAGDVGLVDCFQPGGDPEPIAFELDVAACPGLAEAEAEWMTTAAAYLP